MSKEFYASLYPESIAFFVFLLDDSQRKILSILKIRVIIRINCLYQIVWNLTKWFFLVKLSLYVTHKRCFWATPEQQIIFIKCKLLFYHKKLFSRKIWWFMIVVMFICFWHLYYKIGVKKWHDFGWLTFLLNVIMSWSFMQSMTQWHYEVMVCNHIGMFRLEAIYFPLRVILWRSHQQILLIFYLKMKYTIIKKF